MCYSRRPGRPAEEDAQEAKRPSRRAKEAAPTAWEQNVLYPPRGCSVFSFWLRPFFFLGLFFGQGHTERASEGNYFKSYSEKCLNVCSLIKACWAQNQGSFGISKHGGRGLILRLLICKMLLFRVHI